MLSVRLAHLHAGLRLNVEGVRFGALAGKVSGLSDGWAAGKVMLRYALVKLGSSTDVKRIMRWTGTQALAWEIPVGGGSSGGGEEEEEEQVRKGGGFNNNNKHSVEGWISQYRAAQPTVESAREEADRHMGEFMARRETLKDELDARRLAPDDDGFQLVKRKHTARSSGNTRASNRKSRRRNKRNGAGKELQGFYRFQMRETKRNKLAELRERFAEDKKRVDRLRAKKKFKLAGEGRF